MTVAAVALPLNVGLAIASGMPPSAGIVAGMIGGAVAAVFGGSQYQVSGPAAALSVMVLALTREFGTTGVAAATVFIGVIEIALALLLAGRVVKYVPESVLAGFTTGVGLKLLDQQLPELLGFPEIVDWAHDGHVATIDIVQMVHHPRWLHDVSWHAAVCGLFVIFVVTSMQRFKRFPAAIVSIGLVTFVSVYVHWDIQRVASIGEVPRGLPRPAVPLVQDEQWIDLLVKTLPLALLAAAESLLSASAIDRMANAKRPHDPNLELIGQGLANVAVGFFRGMPVTGVVARSGVGVQSGARTRIAALCHAILLGAAVMFLGAAIREVPLAALAGLLCVIGYRLVEIKTLVHLYESRKPEALAFVVAAAGTVSGHLMVGLVGGLAIHFFDRWLRRHERAQRAALEDGKKKGIRAVIDAPHVATRRPEHVEQLPGGRVVVPRSRKDLRAMIAGEPSSIYVGDAVSIAQDALVHGPCYIGDDTVIGAKAVVHDAVVGRHCVVGAGAVIVGVEVPDHCFVPDGCIVDSADAVASLSDASEAHSDEPRPPAWDIRWAVDPPKERF